MDFFVFVSFITYRAGSVEALDDRSEERLGDNIRLGQRLKHTHT